MASPSRRNRRVARPAAGLTPRQSVPIGALLVVAGSVPVLAALGVIDSPDEDFGAPRWVVAMIAGIFPAVGIHLLCQGLAGLLPHNSVGAWMVRHAAAGALHLMVWCFFIGLAIFFTLEFIEPGTVDAWIMGYPVPADSFLGRAIGRTVAGLGALVVYAILAVASWHALKKRWKGAGTTSAEPASLEAPPESRPR